MSFLGKVQSAVENGLNRPPMEPSSKTLTVKSRAQAMFLYGREQLPQTPILYVSHAGVGYSQTIMQMLIL